VPYETALQQWRAGERRLAAAPPARRRTLEAVVAAIVAGLRRRLGGPFRTDELVELYERGTDWCLDIALGIAPEDPWAWEVDTVADAAFARYLREATDYAGGTRRI
jgi:hypothetical protein